MLALAHPERDQTRHQRDQEDLAHEGLHDGQSLRALDKAEVVLIAPSRCGKTPTTMYLALQHGLFVANYPLVEEDLEAGQME